MTTEREREDNVSISLEERQRVSPFLSPSDNQRIISRIGTKLCTVLCVCRISTIMLLSSGICWLELPKAARVFPCSVLFHQIV